MLKINTGFTIIPIERDGESVGSISFNASDAVWVEKLYSLFEKLESKEKEYAKKEEKLAKSTELDKYGIPKNFKGQVALYRESCEYVREEIDLLFGVGTSEIVFGSTNSFEVFNQFLNGITPFVQKTREEKMGKYLNREQKRAAGLK